MTLHALSLSLSLFVSVSVSLSLSLPLFIRHITHQRIQVHREGLLEEIQQGEESPVPRLEGDIRQEQGDSLLPQEGEGNPREQGDSHRVRL